MLKVADGLHNVLIGHVAGDVIVLTDADYPMMVAVFLVKRQKIRRVLGHQYIAVGGSAVEMLPVGGTAQADLRRDDDSVASLAEKVGKSVGVGAVIEVQP